MDLVYIWFMVKNAIIFYAIMLLILVLSIIGPFSFSFGLALWYLAALIGNIIIIQKAIAQKPPQKKALIICSSIFLILPILYFGFLVSVISC